MSVNKLNELIEKNLSVGMDIFRAGPAGDIKIERAEKALGLVFPPSYKEYLRSYGFMEIDRKCLAGLTQEDVGSPGDVVAFTKSMREEYALPNRYIVLDFPDGDEFMCIDTGVNLEGGENPIVLISPDDVEAEGHVISTGIIDYLIEYLSA